MSGARAAIARRELPLGPTSTFHRNRGEYVPIPGHKSFHTSQLQQPGDENGDRTGPYCPARWETPTPLVFTDLLRFMESARGKSFPSGKRRGSAAPGEGNVQSPDQKTFHAYTTPSARKIKRRSHGSIPSRAVWKPQPHWLVADWLRLMQPVRRESSCSIILRLHRSFKVSIGLDESSCPEARGSRPGYTSTLSAQRGSNPGNKLTAQKLLST